MKKLILSLVFVLAFLPAANSASGPSLTSMRDEIFKSSQEIKSYLKDTKDPVLLNSMWDSCIITVSQLDAYFYMVGIFNTIKKENVTNDSVKYLTSWLRQMQETNYLNIQVLDSVKSTRAPKTKVHMLKIKNNFNELNKLLVAELIRVSKYQLAVSQAQE